MSDINVILAEHTGLGTVRLCECKSIHMSVGPVTLNMAVEAFMQTATLIRQAMETLAVIVAAGELDQEQPSTFKPTNTPIMH
jgi:hypothetical protein